MYAIIVTHPLYPWAYDPANSNTAPVLAQALTSLLLKWKALQSCFDMAIQGYNLLDASRVWHDMHSM